jgi:hypothetical protein
VNISEELHNQPRPTRSSFASFCDEVMYGHEGREDVEMVEMVAFRGGEVHEVDGNGIAADASPVAGANGSVRRLDIGTSASETALALGDETAFPVQDTT